jgi:hypothetical protein
MRWREFELEQTTLAELGRHRLGDPGVVLVGTIRRDGSPRLSPVEPLFWDGNLWFSMGWGSRKAADLQRDARILVHSIVTSREGTEGEYKVRGDAIAELDPAVQQGYARAIHAEAGWEPQPGRFHLFRIDVHDVTFIRWDSSTNDQFVTRWPSRREFVRRGTSATSVGDPEPFSELLAEGDVAE